ncbi:peptide-methionine (S)-S-oxide reductase [Roseibium sediminis]|uniref:peptide-methionine (S)-S-oxide reductase n=1 Tax=Roseibium sediminis TaxID=1775174 RepID=UPI00123CA88B|nr:peptide-methionine (S)-S-oxide reductase [Roseibium sediminis]
MKRLQKIGFGGGCHWCTEAVFQALSGVSQVDQGFMMSDAPHDSWSEAVGVIFDPGIIPLEVLTEIHLRTHASTSNHKMRGKYRSAVYVFDEDQSAEVQRILARLQEGFDEPLVTQVLEHRGFRASDERFQNYREKNAERPFCQTYIDPKLTLLRKQFTEHVGQS